jgi:hypothetical protein
MAIIRIKSESMDLSDDYAFTGTVTGTPTEPAFKNLIINGDMSIAQRGTSQTSVGSTSGYYTLDRFEFGKSGSANDVFTMSQSTEVPTGQGFGKSLKMEVTTAETSIASNAQYSVRQRIEGQMLQQIKKGTSNAESITLSFWVKSNKTGTYIVSLDDKDNTRTTSKSYTINSASTWEKKTITYDADTTGAFDDDNAVSLDIRFILGAGSNFTSGTLATTWESTTNANVAVGQVNFLDTLANEWYITGLQLEVGTSASDFEFLPYDVNLQRCQRYYYKQADASSGTNQIVCVGFYESSSVIFGVIDFPVTMRTLPSNVSASGANYYDIYRNGANDNFDSLSNALVSPKTAGFFSTQGSGTGGQAGSIRTNRTDAYVAFDAEL